MALGLARMAISDAARAFALAKSGPGMLSQLQPTNPRRILLLFAFNIFFSMNLAQADEYNVTIEVNRQTPEEIIEETLTSSRDIQGLAALRSAPFMCATFSIFLWHNQTWLQSIGPAGTRLAPRDSIIGYDHGQDTLLSLHAAFQTSLALCTTPRGVVGEAPTRVYALLTREEAVRFRGHFEDQVRIEARLNVTPIPDADRGPDRAAFRIEFVIHIRPLRTRELVVAARYSIRSGQINTQDDLAVVALRNLPAIGCAIGRLIS